MENVHKGGSHSDGTIILSHAASEHLLAALEQMDLLLTTNHAEAGLEHLLVLLKHLRSFRRIVA